jgi:hypothetical protein
MKARTKDYPAGPIVAFGGCEFVNYEYRDVPAGFEKAAKEHPYLEIEQEPQPEPVSAMVEPVSKPKPPARKRGRPRKTTTRKRAATKPKGTTK